MSDLASLISQITIQSEYGPDIVIDQPFAATPSNPAVSFIMGILKPQITVVSSLGTRTVAPWGTPDPTAWPTVQILLLGLLGLGVVLAIKRFG